MFSDSVIKRYLSKVVRKDGCWGWNGTKTRGYGMLATTRGKSPVRAHRVSWFIHNGEIPHGLEVCHKCDNPECSNPDHLFLGTHKENMIDAHKKGRLKFYKHEKGEKNNVAKLTDAQVKNIRREYANGETIKSLSEKYKHSNIVRIVRNICYHDPNFKPINGNSKPRPTRRSVDKEDCRSIEKSILSSRKLARIYGVSKTTILVIKRGDYFEC